MPIQVPTASEPGFASQVRDIVNDIGDLIRQQLQFAQAEIKADLRKSREAMAFFALGAGSAFLGVLFFGLTVVYLLHWLTATGEVDSAHLPLWSCYLIVAVLFLTPGAVLMGMGK